MYVCDLCKMIISCLTSAKRCKNGPSRTVSNINYTSKVSEKVQFVYLDNLCQEIFNFKTLNLFWTPCTFSEIRSFNFLSENVNFISVGNVALIVSVLLSQSCRKTPVST